LRGTVTTRRCIHDGLKANARYHYCSLMPVEVLD
jgi:hypothetical protein